MRISDWSSDVCSSDLGRARPHHGRKALQGSDGDGCLTGVKVETHALCDQCGGCNDRPHGGGEHVEMIDVQIRAKLAGAHVGKSEADSNRRPRRGSRCRYIDRRISNIDGLRSEEHTSELQSLMRHSYAVSSLKKQNNKLIPT